MSWLLRLVFLFVLGLFLRPLWRWLTGGPPPAAGRAPPPLQGVMKRDPVCGTFVDVELALVEPAAGALIHFCSERCRAAWRAQQAPLPQSGTGQAG